MAVTLQQPANQTTVKPLVFRAAAKLEGFTVELPRRLNQ